MGEHERLTVIGITGKARSGKDTTANILSTHFGAVRIGLADGVRSALRDLDGPTWEFSKEVESVRATLQILGTEAREDLDIPGACVHHWINHVLVKIRYASHYHRKPRNRFVIPDIRFKAELDWLQWQIEKWGGVFRLWKVERPNSGLSGVAAQHKSETELESLKPDVVLDNSRSIPYLHGQIEGCVPHHWHDLGARTPSVTPTITAVDELRKHIDRATKHVESRPEWKRGILEASGRPECITPRKCVVNDERDLY